MEMAYVFEKNGDILLAEIIDPSKYVFMGNLRNFITCPQEAIAGIPKRLINYCKENAKSYLRVNSMGQWEITTE